MKKLLKIVGIIFGVLLVLFIGLVVLANVINPLPATQATHATPVSHGTIQPTVQPVATIAPVPTASPIVKPVATKKPAMQVTHGRPQLGGNISDFYGKYGSQLFGVGVQQGTAPSGAPDGRVSWLVDNNLLVVSYYTPSSSVYSINLSQADWTPIQYQTYLLDFAPANSEVNNQAPNTPDLIAYTSPTIAHMFLHLDSGSGYINIV